ncbi:hypothetical protein C7405_101344 [Paraburkholderia caballeronis]|uniref:exo-rhamnogalacturonan lyase family protein n=1 Tax=Paraburkholderia caballeronis TaxID=416943 RepID=UPI0010648B47|nr:Tat pathway signal sequence domain protein [Paraburkholderia caballeronis]TDV39227.1 hypothetical protein C7405_101344 [Paraburkholderia caballeronis]
MKRGFDRRTFFKTVSLALGAAPLRDAAARDDARRHDGDNDGDSPTSAPLQWLDGAPDDFAGTTWGVPWPQGAVRSASAFVLRGGDGTQPVQSWPLATWPDGSIKWSAHALAPDDLQRVGGSGNAGRCTLEPANGETPNGPALATQTADAIQLDTGPLQCVVPRSGDTLFRTISRRGAATLRDGRLVVLADDRRDTDDETQTPTRSRYRGQIDSVTLEQNGPSRAVVKLTGAHRDDRSHRVLPFVVRLYFYRGSDNVRAVHSLVYDVDPTHTFIRGIGLRFSAPLDGELHERHVRFVGDNGGVFAEAVRGLTGLRRSPGHEIEAAQVAGHAVPSAAELGPVFAKELRFVPAFGDYTLLQPTPDGFTIEKRTQAGCGWIHSASGTRAAGTGYLGTPGGGVAFGIRHFWQSFPAQIDIANAQTDAATVTLWLWAPNAPAMDLRPYHDGLGETTYELQRDALDITYEDYEPGFMTPYGVARTSEIELQLLATTPTPAQLAAISRRIQAPPQLVAPGAWLDRAGVFSPYWRPVERGPAPAAARLEHYLGWVFDYYRAQVEQRKWYGFWNHGDVMHTYDASRHVWRYDVGGFAWDNGELSTEIWLWHYYLHSGRADAFRMAEAMTRHCSEVDVHHIGPFSPLGSRHDVQHWGDSAKQLRVSTVFNHRFFYYLTADERVGDLMREQVNAVERLRQILPGRKIGERFPEQDPEHHATVSFGTDWGAVASAWLTEWERTGDPAWREKLRASMESIAGQPHGFFTGAGVMDLRTGRFLRDTTGTISVSHLSAAFGLPEVCGELLRTLPVPAFRDAWLQYCTLYSASADEQQAALGQSLGKLNLSQGHARLLAFAGRETGRPDLLQRAWAQFFAGKAGSTYADFESRRIRVPDVLYDIDEARRVSTNSTAQWGLGAIGLLALAAPQIPAEDAP